MESISFFFLFYKSYVRLRNDLKKNNAAVSIKDIAILQNDIFTNINILITFDHLNYLFSRDFYIL